MLRKNMDKPQPAWVMMVRFFRSELEMVSFTAIWDWKKHSNKWGSFTVRVVQRNIWISVSRWGWKLKGVRLYTNSEKEAEHTIRMAKNVKCVHSHETFVPLNTVRHPWLVQLGRLPVGDDQCKQCRAETAGGYNCIRMRNKKRRRRHPALALLITIMMALFY